MWRARHTHSSGLGLRGPEEATGLRDWLGPFPGLLGLSLSLSWSSEAQGQGASRAESWEGKKPKEPGFTR